jgi:hypothetical protein
VRAWAGEPVDPSRRDGTYPLFAFVAALATAPHDDDVLPRTVGRIGLLDRLSAFDENAEVHGRIERLFAELTATPPPSPGPPRDELLAAVSAAAAA